MPTVVHTHGTAERRLACSGTAQRSAGWEARPVSCASCSRGRGWAVHWSRLWEGGEESREQGRIGSLL